MQPIATKSDLPSPQDIHISIHNAFVNFLKQLTTNIQILKSQVIAFQGISGQHTGDNLGKYFVGLCEQAGIVMPASSKLFCITADNTSNNNTTCDTVERLLQAHQVFSFNSFQHHLPCLAHVINLAVTAFMSHITKISAVETTTTIWEFNPSLDSNCILDNFLDIVATIRTLAIKIQCSGQHIEYFKTLQKKCSIDPILSIPLHSNVRWGTADGMLGQSYALHQAINLFINLADELYGPITTVHQDGCVHKRIPWKVFSLKPLDWECVNDARRIVTDANKIQQCFPDKQCSMLWQAIPILEELQTAWEKKQKSGKFLLFHAAIQDGLNKINKYYNHLDNKPVYVLALVLHPYYKLDYIKMAWGGAAEQAKEIAAGSKHAKNWHDKALKVVKATMQHYWEDLEAESATVH
ncbi:hypothetical protein JVU11DRAFT_8120 [Chiua virens]|nr:hypothetical protein JVU11DRAFT_8120 [Chiua virens]